MFTSIYTMAILAGLVSFLSACIIPMLTVYFSLITGMTTEELQKVGNSSSLRKKVIINTLLFIVAFTIVFTIAGAASSKVASFIKENVSLFNILGGIMVIFLALKQLGLFKFVSLRSKFLTNLFEQFKDRAATSYLTTFFTGIFFAIACSHCIGPILYSVLIFAGSTGSSVTGMTVMFLFSIGLAIPYLLTGIAFGKTIRLLERFKKNQKLLSYLTGIILLVFGVLLLFNKFTLMVEILYKVIPFRVPLGM